MQSSCRPSAYSTALLLQQRDLSIQHGCVCTALTRGNKEEAADDEDTSPDYRTDSLDQLQQKVPNLMAQMNGIAHNPTTAQIIPS